MTAAGRDMLLSVRNVSKTFGSVRALNDVSLDVAPGEVLGLLGANGAGKSTLIGVLSGAIRPDSGSVSVNGREIRTGSLADARAAGITVVHQELMLFPDRSVEENVFASVLPQAPLRPVDRRARRRRVEAVLDRVGAFIDLRARVEELPLPRRQLVEIARALCAGGSILVLDEPTSALSQPEAEGLFAAVRSIVAEDAAVIFVSHRLDEVFAQTDRITVLRDGSVEGHWPTADVDIATVTRAMVGDPVGQRRRGSTATFGATALAMRHSPMAPGSIDFSIRIGEIVGFAGLEGSGISSVMEMLGGVTPSEGVLDVGGRPVALKHPAEAIAKGIVFMPPDRKKGGLWLDRTSAFNIGAAAVTRMEPFRWLSANRINAAAVFRMGQTGVRADALQELAGRLSGGNQQRLLLGRLLDLNPKVLLLNDFTRGVDVKAKAGIHRLVRQLADQGLAICVTCPDMEELLDVVDRVVCMRRGQVVADRPSSTLDKLTLLALASAAPDDVSLPAA
jgi:ABC-type sugar transport system ATPase subunit